MHDSGWLAALNARANRAPARPRVPLLLGADVIGSVEPDYLEQLEPALRSGPGAPLRREQAPAGLRWHVCGEGTPALRQIADALLAANVGRVARQWRDEQLAVCNRQGQRLATVERGVVRPLGIATRAVHLVGRTLDGRFWVQQRALDKANDPGLWDTLMGGMVAASDTLASALERETWEEAGLRLAQLHALAYGGSVSLRRPDDELGGAGYVEEHIDWYHCTVPADQQPLNQDGEVAQFGLWTRAELLRRLRREHFTLEAALILVAALALQAPSAD